MTETCEKLDLMDNMYQLILYLTSFMGTTLAPGRSLNWFMDEEK